MSDAKAASPRADSKAGANTTTTTSSSSSISAGSASARGPSGGQAEAKVSARGSARVDYNDSKDGAAPPQQGSARASARER